MTETNTPKLYFPGLNGLRFIAALTVFIAHVEHFVKACGGNYLTFYVIDQLGGAGVNLFFVISGYLITYLLMIEKESYQRISLRNFYVRRVLRIWPLYYFIMIITMIMIPLFIRDELFGINGISGIGSFVLFTLFMPFVSICIYPSNFMANILWSVGVEEMYYLFWPLILKSIKKITLGLFLFLLVFFVSLNAIATYLPYKVHTMNDVLNSISAVFKLLRVDNMIIGGMMAYIALHKPNLKKLILSDVVFLISFVLLMWFLFVGFEPLYFGVNSIVRYLIDPLLFAFLCGVIVINVTHKESLSDPLEGKLLYELGQISYGFYVYHSIALFIAIHFFSDVLSFDKAGVPMHIAMYAAGFILTVCISYISYHYFEAKFLLLKKRFTTVISGNEARASKS